MTGATRDAPADGVWPVMLTPFTESGGIDWPAVDALVEWYVDAGVAGLFAVAQSSEMYELSDAERLDLAARVVDRAGGRVPVVAGGTFAGTVEEQAAFVDRMADTGVDAVVAITSMLTDEAASDDDWLATARDLLARTDAPLGLYECPAPYRRLLSPELLGRLAETGRFRFLKDTSRDVDAVAAKVTAAEGTPLSVYNANLPTLVETLEAGAAGYSGTAANVYPGLVAWLCANHRAPEATGLDQYLTAVDRAIHHQYPGLAKLYHARAGREMTTVCRTHDPAFESQDRRIVDALRGRGEAWRERVGIDPPGA